MENSHPATIGHVPCSSLEGIVTPQQQDGTRLVEAELNVNLARRQGGLMEPSPRHSQMPQFEASS